ncbi:hypothetical protein [Roseitranquillus sediminis]|nr:hypothetical protein [Roseitranquillus sediminis]
MSQTPIYLRLALPALLLSAAVALYHHLEAPPEPSAEAALSDR